MADKKDVTDGFVDVLLGTTRLVRTRVIDNDLNPKFNEKFRYEKIEIKHLFSLELNSYALELMSVILRTNWFLKSKTRIMLDLSILEV